MSKSTKPTTKELRKQLKKIRKIIDTNPSFIDQRLAFIVEEAVSYILDKTDWKGLVETVVENTRIFKAELDAHPLSEISEALK